MIPSDPGSEKPAPTQFRRLTQTESNGISPPLAGPAVHREMQTRFAERPETLFFAAIQDFNGLRGSLRGPIVFADVRTLRAKA